MYSHTHAMRTWLTTPVIIAVAAAGTALAGVAVMPATAASAAALPATPPVTPISAAVIASPRISILSDPQCPVISSGSSTFTLAHDCTTTETISVPDGITLNGGGHIITAEDASSTDRFTFTVVTNAGSRMNIENLTVRANVTSPTGVTLHRNLAGVAFTDASGFINNVDVLDMTEHSRDETVGVGIRIVAPGANPQNVTVTNTRVSGFQRGGLLADGNVTADVSGSTFGPPDLPPTPPEPNVRPAQIAAQYSGGARGTFTDNEVIGTTFGAARSYGAGLQLVHTSDVTVSNNTFGGVGTDIGIVVFQSTNIRVEFNHIARMGTRPGFADTYGVGAWAFDDQSSQGTTLICNTFAGWNFNLGSLVQPPCITSTSPLPSGTVGVPFKDTLMAFTEPPGAMQTWSKIAGDLPPGLTLNADGTITGTPEKTGTFTFTAQVCEPEPEPAGDTGDEPAGDGDDPAEDLCSSMEFMITIVSTEAPQFTSPASASCTVGAPLTFLVTTTGSPVPALTKTGNLPGGVSFTDNDNGTATIAGTPGSAGTFRVTITADNGVGEPAVQEFTLTCSQKPPTPTPTPTTPSPVPSGPVLTGGGKPAGTSPWLPYGGLAAGIGLLLTIGGLALRRKGTGA